MSAKPRNKRIVVLDDNKFELQAHISDLELRGYDVCVFGKVDAFLADIRSEKPVDLFILDIMIGEPIIRVRDVEIPTNDGLKTGKIIHKLLRYSGVETPIILLSTAWLDVVKQGMAEIESNYENTACLDKNGTTAENLGSYVEELFQNGKVTKKKRWAKLLGDALVVKPSVFGIGIDLRKLK